MVRATAAFAVVSVAVLLVSAASASTRSVGGASTSMYTVAFTSGSLPADVDKLVAEAGGTIVVRLPELGGLGVSTSNPSFTTKLSSIASVAAAGASMETSLPPINGRVDRGSAWNAWRHFVRKVPDNRHGRAPGIGDDPQLEPDHLGPQQWDKMRLNVSLTGSYRIERGRSDVRVAFTDTGVDTTHPDIAPNLDTADSRSFVPGDETIQDFNGHGTWVAGAVGAPINEVGISGVAPRVSLVGLKTQAPDGSGLLLYFDQALVYAAQKRVDIVSSSLASYFETCEGAPPGYPCDPADVVLAQRAVDYARARGVTIVAGLGNDNVNVGDRVGLGAIFGVPDPVVEVPGGLDGVIGVAATNYESDKAFYSNYGVGAVDVTAPGGDFAFGLPPSPPYLGGGELPGAWTSTQTAGDVPDLMTTDCVGSVCGTYGWDIGTSMATPNVAGVAALIISRYGDFGAGNDGPHLRPDKVEKILLGTATPIPCPNPRTVVYGGEFPFDQATCNGPRSFNDFYGAGMANAVAALSRGDR